MVGWSKPARAKHFTEYNIILAQTVFCRLDFKGHKVYIIVTHVNTKQNTNDFVEHLDSVSGDNTSSQEPFYS